MQIAVSAYHQKWRGQHLLTPITPGMFDWTIHAGDLSKARERLIERVRKELPALDRRLFARLHVPVGRRLEHPYLELVLHKDGEKRRISGYFPVLLEDRPTGGQGPMRIAYHPRSAAAWFELSSRVSSRSMSRASTHPSSESRSGSRSLEEQSRGHADHAALSGRSSEFTRLAEVAPPN
ncbi:MAG: hypothetical protein WDO74_29045 [Pseudomonadota bacterium]